MVGFIKKAFVERDNAPISVASLILISRTVAPIPVEGFRVWCHCREPFPTLSPNLQPRTAFLHYSYASSRITTSALICH